VEIGKRVRTRREALGLTQNELAGELGVTHQHISRIEGGSATPSLDLLVGLAAKLGTTSDWLLTGNETSKLGAREAIRGEQGLSAGAKRHLIGLVEELRR
jgi:transcriptional regulator with XRE-family HTH domain